MSRLSRLSGRTWLRTGAVAAVVVSTLAVIGVAGPGRPAPAVKPAPSVRGSTDSGDSAVAQAAQAAQARPNIVFIMVDDMRDDDLRFMPWTRRLIRDQGVRFVNSFAPFPLCCPARASVLTGRYAHNHQVYGVNAPYAFPSFHDRSTIATWLHDAGYATVYVGKYLNGYGSMPRPGHRTGKSLHYVPPGWSRWRASIDGGLPASDPRAGGTYNFFDTTLSRNGEGFVNYRGRYQSRVYGELTEEIIRGRAPAARPYFLYVSYTAPHSGSPVEPDDPAPVRRNDGQLVDFLTTARPDDVKGRFDRRVRAAPGADWKDPDFSDKPGYLRAPPINAAERRAMLEVTRQRAEALSVVDSQVRRTVAAVEASGEARRTLILFTSDNGYFLGEQRRRQGKIFPHEPSLRVPLLLRGPGIAAGGRRHDPVTSIDLAPTLADLAGVTPPSRVDGVSVLDVARHGDRGWVRAVLTETGPMMGVRRNTNEAGQPLSSGGRRDVRFAIGVRTSRYLYVDLAGGARELYDLAKDPREYRNLVGVRAYAATQRELAQVLDRVRACDGRACAAPLPRSSPPARDAAPDLSG
ncbi:sulfatase family protein [Nocardioides mesophilus]|uniref:Sulfatase n=1 Tax=Nocardioides mesophilus TaxID=433659 RepID=A0A7G9RCC8_9ACTN|nr:sulfatase [Nocardioides mesophilus]QNN53253.1 sulfatase [Nocardioides mesophilus]